MTYLLVINIDLESTGLGYSQAIKTLNLALNWYRNELQLVYVSRHSYAVASESAHQRRLLEPNFWITASGTEIHDRSGALVQQWADYLSERWSPGALASFMQDFPSLSRQPDAEQNPWKLSYSLKPLRSPYVLQKLNYRLARSTLNARAKFTNNRDVDIMPRLADVGKAADFLRHALNIASTNTIVCGGSGNDISLFQLPVCGVIVGNAKPELRTWHEQHQYPYHYLARANHARGVLEGLQHFNILAELSALLRPLTPASAPF